MGRKRKEENAVIGLAESEMVVDNKENVVSLVPSVKDDNSIYDVLVYRLSITESEVTKLRYLTELKRHQYDDKIRQLQAERQAVLQDLRQQEQIAMRKHLDIKAKLEVTHNINLKDYGFDDELGKLSKIPGPGKTTTEKSAEDKVPGNTVN